MTIIDFFERDRFAKLAGAKLLEVHPGYAKAVMKVEEEHLNGGDACMGGAIYTLADLAFAAAVNSHLAHTVTASSSITFVSGARRGAVLTAEARELMDHKRLPFAEVRITDQRNKLIAVFTATGYRHENVRIDVEKPV